MDAYVADGVAQPQGHRRRPASFSDSHLKQLSARARHVRTHAGVTDPPLTVARGCAFISISLTNKVRERSAGTAQAILGTFAKAPACRVTGTLAFRRSTAAILGPITVLLSSDPTP
jgi:hypothetical protein